MIIRATPSQVLDRLTSSETEITSKAELFDKGIQTKSSLSLSIFEIDQYEKNPRRQANPNYQQIKESIANVGMNQPLVISQRPEESKFFVYKGGNTRLNVIKELYQETGDRRFRYIDCSFHPWTGQESDAIIGHLQENEMRKSLCFMDRAYGVKMAIEHLLEEEQEKLTLRGCHRALAEKGYCVPISTLSLLLYAADNVETTLPKCIATCLGRPQINKLRILENSLKKVCREFNISDAKLLFQTRLREYKHSEWSYSVFRRSIETDLAKKLSLSVQDITLRMEGYLQPSNSPLKNNPTDIDENFAKFENLSWPRSCTNQKHSKNFRSENIQTSSHQSDKKVALTVKPSITPVTSDSPNEGIAKNSLKLSTKHIELNENRNQAYQFACRLAKRHEIHEHSDTKKKIVVDTGNWGVGYLVTDFPPPYPRHLSDTEQGVRDAIWWLLLEFCDLGWAIESSRPLTANIIGKSKMQPYVISGKHRTLHTLARNYMRCSHPHLGLFHFCMRQLDKDSWHDLNNLIDIYREIHRLTRSGELHLFHLIGKRTK